MGAASSKPATAATASPESPTQPGASSGRSSATSSTTASPGACPLGFDKGSSSTGNAATTSVAGGGVKADASSGCPVKGDAATRGSTAPNLASAPAATASGGCPVKEDSRSTFLNGAVPTSTDAQKYKHPDRYNVYSQKLDGGGTGCASGEMNPTNNMPANPNQQPAPGQRQPLSTDRVPSTIPKGGEDSTWTYPSPQMFWNALSRKGKVDDTQEKDMDVVVSIHNNMNELTWRKILQWETMRGGSIDAKDGTEPRLLRFLGRPDEITPKALIKMMMGHPLPFDRHDWVVDRGGDERRYVIDYYHDEGVSDGDEVPELHSRESIKSIKVDVRPALDGFRDFSDRVIKMPLARLAGKNDFEPLPLWPSPTMKYPEPGALLRQRQKAAVRRNPGSETMQQQQQQQQASAAGDAAEQVKAKTVQTTSRSRDRDARVMARVQKKCAESMRALRKAEGQGDAARAQALALKLEYCTARYVCKKEAAAYKEALAFADGASAGSAHAHWAETALEGKLLKMRAALASFTTRQMEAQRERADEADS